MSNKLTTDQIIEYIEMDLCPSEWAWESAIDSAVGNSDARDAADAARFLEKLEPGRTWLADEYLGLMYHHFTGRWESAVYIGYIRARETFDDHLEKFSGDEAKIALVKRKFAERTASDAAAEEFVRKTPGTYVFDCADGTVLTFDRILDGTIIEEEPV